MRNAHRWSLARGPWRLSARRYRLARRRTLLVVRVGPLYVTRYPRPPEGAGGLRVTVHQIGEGAA